MSFLVLGGGSKSRLRLIGTWTRSRDLPFSFTRSLHELVRDIVSALAHC